MSSESNFAYSLKYNTHFVVKNITGETNAQILSEFGVDYTGVERSPKKTVSIFNYPINAGETRDLLQIPGVQEEDIRSSLLKGVLRHKFLCGDIGLVASNIDLLQFSDKQRDFLKKYGFMEGVDVGVDELGQDTVNFIIASGSGALYTWREKIPLIGLRNGTNRTFYTPEKFINGAYFGNTFHITVEHNGKELYENIDYTIAESGGPGTGYDTLNLISLTPNAHSLLYATFAVKV
jgi:hypothetical protein